MLPMTKSSTTKYKLGIWVLWSNRWRWPLGQNKVIKVLFDEPNHCWGSQGQRSHRRTMTPQLHTIAYSRLDGQYTSPLMSLLKVPCAAVWVTGVPCTWCFLVIVSYPFFSLLLGEQRQVFWVNDIDQRVGNLFLLTELQQVLTFGEGSDTRY